MNTIVLDNIYSKIIGDKIPYPVINELNNQLSYSLKNAYCIIKNMNTKNIKNYQSETN